MRPTLLRPMLLALALIVGAAPAAQARDAWSDDVAHQFEALGLKPADHAGFVQSLKLQRQTLAAERSSISLAGDVQLDLRRDLVLDLDTLQPGRLDAQLIFVGDHVPTGAALKRMRGAVAVVVDASPAATPEARAALIAAGVTGVLVAPGRATPEAQLATAGYPEREAPRLLSAALTRNGAELLFAGAPLPYATVVEAMEAGRPVSAFPLAPRLRADLSLKLDAVASANVVAVAPGADPLLAGEYVVVSAPASAAAAVVEAARLLSRPEARPKRSVLFAVLAPEQDGAPGARALATRPPATRLNLIASLTAGLDPAGAGLVIDGLETTLGGLAHDAAVAAHLPVVFEAGALAAAPNGFLSAGIPAVRLSLPGGAEPSAFLAAFARQVADGEHPMWVRGSRFAPRQPEAEPSLTAPVNHPVRPGPEPKLQRFG